MAASIPRAAAFANNIHAGHRPDRHGNDAFVVGGADHAAALYAGGRQLAGTQHGHTVMPVRNGTAGIIQGSMQVPGSKAYRPGPLGPHIDKAPVDMTKYFKTGHVAIAPQPAPRGFLKPMLNTDDMGTKGLGTAKTNDVQTKQVRLEPLGYESAYNDENQMQALLPTGSFVFQYCPDDKMARSSAVCHTVSAINRFMRSTGKTDASFRDGRVFRDMWRFAGVPISVERFQGVQTASKVLMVLCVRGQQNVKNIFAATGKTAQCGSHLYLLLRKIQHNDVTDDIAFADQHAQHQAPYYNHLRAFAAGEGGAVPDERGRAYWQLVPHMTVNDEPPPFWMYNGPDWEGTYYHVGRVEQDDSIKQFPKKDEARVLATVYPRDATGMWQESFSRLNTLSVNVGGTE
jgi:hypothetical protein